MLHILNQSPTHRDYWIQNLTYVSGKDAVLLIENAVYAARADALSVTYPRHKETELYVLAADLWARGLAETPLHPRYKTIDYQGFVRLTITHPLIQSW